MTSQALERLNEYREFKKRHNYESKITPSPATVPIYYKLTPKVARPASENFR